MVARPAERARSVLQESGVQWDPLNGIANALLGLTALIPFGVVVEQSISLARITRREWISPPCS